MRTRLYMTGARPLHVPSLGEANFATAWADGRAMMLEQAIEYALDTGPRPEEGHVSPSNVAPK
jgi:hypothetical protein